MLDSVLTVGSMLVLDAHKLDLSLLWQVASYPEFWVSVACCGLLIYLWYPRRK